MVLSLSPPVSISLYYLNSNPIPREPKLTSFSTRQHKYSTPLAIQCSSTKSSTSNNTQNLKTCKNCKTQFDPLLNHPRACRFHTAHFGGETKRKFESVYSGGTMNTPNSGQVIQYWHCCGSEDPFDPGCTSAPHASYDD